MFATSAGFTPASAQSQREREEDHPERHHETRLTPERSGRRDERIHTAWRARRNRLRGARV